MERGLGSCGDAFLLSVIIRWEGWTSKTLVAESFDITARHF